MEREGGRGSGRCEEKMAAGCEVTEEGDALHDMWVFPYMFMLEQYCACETIHNKSTLYY
jgi:hypothetical protein